MNKNQEKSAKEEHKGDQLVEKGKLKQAFKCYQKAQSLDSERIPLYDKLIETQKKIGVQLTDEEFAESLSWTMKKQELENPAFKRIHAQMEPEWQEVIDLIKKMMNEKDEKKETETVEKIAGYGNVAVYPLVEILLSFKKLGRK